MGGFFEENSSENQARFRSSNQIQGRDASLGPLKNTKVLPEDHPMGIEPIFDVKKRNSGTFVTGFWFFAIQSMGFY